MMTKEISNDINHVIFDDCDALSLAILKLWRSGVVIWCSNQDGSNRMPLGRFLLNAADPRFEVDHKDQNFYNFKRGNLRFATHAQNSMNRGLQFNNTSGYKGVCWHKGGKKWLAQIMLNQENIYLGLFKSPIRAAQTYDKKAKELFGDFAVLNFPENKEIL